MVPMQWYYAKGGTQLGPVEALELKARISAGEVGPGDLVWREGMGDWTPAGQVAELRTEPSAVAPSTGISPVSDGVGTPISPYQTPAAAGYGGAYAVTEKIPNYLWQSIVVTLFCCQPLGIPAIVFAAKVDEIVLRGDIAGAREASRKAKMWCWWSFGSWLVGVAAYIAVIVIAGVSGNMRHF